MVDCTDHLFRKLIRLISPKTRLYSEMLVADAVLQGDRARLLHFDAIEHPIAVQLASSEPHSIAEAAVLAEATGYDEINLNAGCPSPRAGAGSFGACLFKTPERVAEMVSAMTDRCALPVSVKTRIGVDNCDSPEDLLRFVSLVSQAGCNTFLLHARKAWLSGLNPKQNRQLPALQYHRVCELKQHFPELTIIINGGIDADSDLEVFSSLDGVMVGRAAYRSPMQMARLTQQLWQEESTKVVPTTAEVLKGLAPYALIALRSGFSPFVLLKHLNGLTHGLAGANRWRKHAHRCACDYRNDELFWQSLIQSFPGVE